MRKIYSCKKRDHRGIEKVKPHVYTKNNHTEIHKLAADVTENEDDGTDRNPGDVQSEASNNQTLPDELNHDDNQIKRENLEDVPSMECRNLETSNKGPDKFSGDCDCKQCDSVVQTKILMKNHICRQHVNLECLFNQ